MFSVFYQQDLTKASLMRFGSCKEFVKFCSTADRHCYLAWLRACEARAVRAHKTLTPRVTDFFTDFEEKTDCFAVYGVR